MCKTRVITAQSIITKVNKSLYVTIGTSSLLKYPAAGISPLQFPWQGYSVFDVSKSGLIPLLSFGVRGVRYRHPFDCPILDCQRHICNRGSFPLVEPVLFVRGLFQFWKKVIVIVISDENRQSGHSGCVQNWTDHKPLLAGAILPGLRRSFALSYCQLHFKGD